MVALLAREYGCDKAYCKTLEQAALLHDIGNLAIPSKLLSKNGALEPEERLIVNTHTVIGAELIAKWHSDHDSQADQSAAWLEIAAEISRHHHEWWNGKGYPATLCGPAIPFSARLTALAAAFDSLTHPRPYRLAISPAQALAEIESLRGEQFDPVLTTLFSSVIQRLQKTGLNIDQALWQEVDDPDGDCQGSDHAAGTNASFAAGDLATLVGTSALRASPSMEQLIFGKPEHVYMRQTAISQATSLGITPREMDVLRCLMLGQSNKKIALALNISERTVGHHVEALFKKTGVKSRTELAIAATRRGILTASADGGASDHA
jgi:DNA-binding CsgD family transcriptional regulator